MENMDIKEIEFLHFDEVMKLLRVSRTFLEGIVESGEIESAKIGGRIKITTQAVKAYIEKNTKRS